MASIGDAFGKEGRPAGLQIHAIATVIAVIHALQGADYDMQILSMTLLFITPTRLCRPLYNALIPGLFVCKYIQDIQAPKPLAQVTLTHACFYLTIN